MHTKDMFMSLCYLARKVLCCAASCLHPRQGRHAHMIVTNARNMYALGAYNASVCVPGYVIAMLAVSLAETVNGFK